MSKCPYDGYRVVEVGKEVYRCLYCDNFFEVIDGELRPLSLHTYPYEADLADKGVIQGLGRPKQSGERGQATQMEEGGGEIVLTDAQRKWIRNVCSRLIPHRPNELPNVTALRNKYKKWFVEVFKGERELQDWIEKTRSDRGMKEVDLLSLMIQELSKMEEIRYNKDMQGVRKMLRQRKQLLQQGYG